MSEYQNTWAPYYVGIDGGLKHTTLCHYNIKKHSPDYVTHTDSEFRIAGT